MEVLSRVGCGESFAIDGELVVIVRKGSSKACRYDDTRSRLAGNISNTNIDVSSTRSQHEETRRGRRYDKVAFPLARFA